MAGLSPTWAHACRQGAWGRLQPRGAAPWGRPCPVPQPPPRVHTGVCAVALRLLLASAVTRFWVDAPRGLRCPVLTLLCGGRGARHLLLQLLPESVCTDPRGVFGKVKKSAWSPVCGEDSTPRGHAQAPGSVQTRSTLRGALHAAPWRKRTRPRAWAVLAPRWRSMVNEVPSGASGHVLSLLRTDV